MSLDCVERNLKEVGVEKKDINTVLSYTPLHSSPAYSTKCLPLKELRRDVVHTPFHALASAGGVGLLSYAHQYLLAHPTHAALTITAECGSRLWSKGGSFDVALRNMITGDVVANKEKICQQIVVASLLGDGLSSCLVLGKEHPLLGKIKANKSKVPRIVDTYSSIIPDTGDCLGSHLTDSAPIVFMNKRLADIAPVAMIDAVNILLEKNKLTKNDIKMWLAHPGGPKILQTVQTNLNMTQHDFRYSWNALAEVGNVSSVSVLRAFELCMEENPNIPPNTWGVMVAVGPGIRVEAALLCW